MTSPTLDLVVTTRDHDSLDPIVDLARTAESHGYSRVSAGETTDWDVVTAAAVVGRETDSIGVSTDVLSPYGRAPTVLGQTALTLHDATDGRFRLGVGASSPALAERWHGTDFDRPLRRLRETIAIVRELYDGGTVSYDGEIFQLGGLELDCPVPDDPPGIDVAALGPKATELAGRFGDGWVPQMFTPDGLRDRMGDLERGANLAGKSTDDVRVAPLVRCCALEDRETARSLARRTVAFLIGAYGPFYGNAVAQQGHEDVVAEIRAAWDDGDTGAMADALPDELLDELAAAGTPEEARTRVQRFQAIEGVDAVRVGFVDGMTPDQKATTMEALSELA